MLLAALCTAMSLPATLQAEAKTEAKAEAKAEAKTEAAPKPPTPTKIFLLIGQSNMAGRAKLEKGDDKPITNAWLLTDKAKWEPAANPFNKYASNRKSMGMQRIGPGFGFVLRMNEAMPNEQIGIIGNARGGTKIEEWVKGKPLYDNTIKRLAAVKNLKLAGVLWHQGEGNRNDKDYLVKLKKLIETLREDLKQPKLPFIAGKIAKESVVNELLEKLPTTVPHTAVVSVDGYKLFDGVHFDRQSQLTIGQRYADAYLKLMESK